MSDVTCAACGSSQAPGSAFCAVCGKPFPRTGHPVEAPPAGPAGQVQLAAVQGAPGGYYRSSPETVTEPEVYSMTQKATPALAAPGGSALDNAPVAGVGRRFLAFVVDVAIPAVIALVVVLVGFALVGAPLLNDVTVASDDEAASLLLKMVLVYVVAGVLSLAWWIGVVFWEGSTGKTVGNLLTGIRTLDASTRGPVGFWRALVRWLMIWVSGIVPVILPVLVVISPAFDSSGRRQGWHDALAKAVVVDARGLSSSPQGAGHAGVDSLMAPPPGGYGAPAPSAAYPAYPAQPGSPQPSQPGPSPSYPSPSYPSQSAPPAPSQGARPIGSFAPPSSSGPAPAAPASDPWAFPSSDAPAGGGLITGIPGAPGVPPVPSAASGRSAAPAQSAAPAPARSAAPAPARSAAPVPAPAPQGPAAGPEAEDPDWDSTRLPSRGAVLEPAPVVPVELELESGERRVIEGPALLGRNPQATGDVPWTLVAVDDPTRSVSKTHAEVGVDSGGLWITDRGSTNGTVVSAPGQPPRVVEAGARARVPVGGTIHLGDRRVVVRAVTR